MQVVPVDLLVTLRYERGLALEAHFLRLLGPALQVAAGGGLVVQGPHQRREVAGTLLGQLLQRLDWEVHAGHGRYGVDAVLHQGNGVEDAFNDPQFLDGFKLEAWWAPPLALRAVPELEAGLHLAEAGRSINQTLPIPTIRQREADRGAGLTTLLVDVVFLSKPAGHVPGVEAPGIFQVGAGG
ncbi:hypothetical protein D3C77_370900 [compost metagenome]